MAQVIVRVILEAHGGSRRPLCMFLCSTLLCQTSQLDLLALPQLANQGSLSLGISDDRVSDCVVHPLALNNQVPCIDSHDATATASVQGKRHAAANAVVIAVAVARVHEVLAAILRVEGDHAQPMGQHLIRENGSVAFNLDQVQCNGGDLGQNRATERVGQSQIDGAQTKVHAVGFRLSRNVSCVPCYSSATSFIRLTSRTVT